MLDIHLRPRCHRCYGCVLMCWKVLFLKEPSNTSISQLWMVIQQCPRSQFGGFVWSLRTCLVAADPRSSGSVGEQRIVWVHGWHQEAPSVPVYPPLSGRNVRERLALPHPGSDHPKEQGVMDSKGPKQLRFDICSPSCVIARAHGWPLKICWPSFSGACTWRSANDR